MLQREAFLRRLCSTSNGSQYIQMSALVSTVSESRISISEQRKDNSPADPSSTALLAKCSRISSTTLQPSCFRISLTFCKWRHTLVVRNAKYALSFWREKPIMDPYPNSSLNVWLQSRQDILWQTPCPTFDLLRHQEESPQLRSDMKVISRALRTRISN